MNQRPAQPKGFSHPALACGSTTTLSKDPPFDRDTKRQYNNDTERASTGAPEEQCKRGFEGTCPGWTARVPEGFGCGYAVDNILVWFLSNGLPQTYPQVIHCGSTTTPSYPQHIHRLYTESERVIHSISTTYSQYIHSVIHNLCTDCG